MARGARADNLDDNPGGHERHEQGPGPHGDAAEAAGPASDVEILEGVQVAGHDLAILLEEVTLGVLTGPSRGIRSVLA